MEDRAKAQAIAADFRTAPFEPRERAIVDYAVKLTNAPQNMRESDVAALRDVGLRDSEILDVCQVVAYYNYVNRLADGLGVELEHWWEAG
jgi:uncharacterized peroxidase-related enzyme